MPHQAKAKHPKQGQKARTRFIEPETPVNERIGQITAHHAGQEKQAQWLKLTLQKHWSRELPQPFVAFDQDENAFIAEWQSDTACNTLIVDASRHSGEYCPWPHENSMEPAETLDLDTEDAWQHLRNALTKTRQ